MQHDPDFTLAHPVIPFAVCPEHIRELLGPLASSKRRTATTKDGRLECRCTDPTNCRLPTTAPVPGKPIIGNASLSRLSALEGRMRAMILDMKEKIEAHRINSAGIRHCALLFPPPFA